MALGEDELSMTYLTKDFLSEIEIRQKIHLGSILFLSADHYKSLYMPWQHSYHGMYMIL